MAKPKGPLCLNCNRPLRRYRWRNEDFNKDSGKEWGSHGDGYFCGQKCGYEWAVRILRRTEKK